MGGYKTHIAVGLLCTTLALLVFNYFGVLDLKFAISAILISIVYSQLPDIDIQSSKIRWILTVSGLGIAFVYLAIFDNNRLATIYLGLVLIMWVIGLIPKFGHRGVTHTIIAGIVFSSLLFYYDYWLVVIAFINYLSHLVVDRKR